MITCTIEGSPDGTTAVDYTVNSATGDPATTGGGSESRPVNHVYPAWDVACAQQAAFAVLATLGRRQRTGKGAQIRLALSDTALATLSHLGSEEQVLGSERPSIGTASARVPVEPCATSSRTIPESRPPTRFSPRSTPPALAATSRRAPRCGPPG